jgi:phage terminase large subunit-like protein
VTAQFEAMKCRLPEEAPWLDEWIEKHVVFPGAHGDLVDTTSGALAKVANATALMWGKLRQRPYTLLFGRHLLRDRR